MLKNATLLTILCLALLLVGCSEEQQNKLSRLGVTWLEGDYEVTYANGSHQKTWRIIGGKITSEPQKGYYYFWANVDGKKAYVQTPIENTYIQEIAQ
ncbi:MAG: hypothetical protein FD130_1521 [Halothiobacillaceae bacterium]|nr:MAG: hypothetical protein FD130_1521 [Halothiobacillaceae bacterium]